MRIFVLFCSVFSVLGNDISQDVGFTKKEMQNLIDLHNYFRMKVAKGEERNQPQAADMIAMEWDDRLVASAQRWASTCPSSMHNDNKDRRFKPYPFTGQNYAGLMGMTESVVGWYDEVKEGRFQFDGVRCSSVCGHYTQVVWSKTHLLGCAQDKCKAYGKDNSKVYCEYAPGGNTVFKMKKDPVYQTGRPCSKCPQGFGFCMGGALCASKRACSNTESKCECTIKRCENGGTFDQAGCQCKCKAGFEGLRCETPCKDNIDFCDSYKAECAWDANMWMWMGKDCRKTCSKCGPLNDPGKTNRDGIKSNVKDMTKELSCKNDANDVSCDMWIKQCQTNPSFMKKKCARACGFCKSEFIKATPPKTKPKNVDTSCDNKHDDNSCDQWAESNQCKTNPGFMLKNCARSCGCPKTKDTSKTGGAGRGRGRGRERGRGRGGGRTASCRNTYDDASCDDWADRGECNTNPGWMSDHCARSCGCPQSKSSSHNLKCKNKYSDKSCTSWANQGECNRNKAWMKSNCARACGCK